MNMDPRHLCYLATVVECGTLHAAASALGLTQPALTRTMQILEARAGVALFDRSGRRSRPTPAGLELAALGRSIRDASDAAGRVARQFETGQSGRLRIGAPPGIAGSFLAPAIAALLSDSADVSVSLSTGLVGELRDRMRAGELDLIVGPVGIGDSAADLAVRRLFDDRIGFLCRKEHPLAARPNISAAALQGSRWVMHPPHSLVRFQTDSALEELGVGRIRVALETESTEAALAVVQATNLLTSLPRLPALGRIEAEGLRFLPVDTPVLNRPIGLITRRSERANPLAERFARALADAVGGATRR